MTYAQKKILFIKMFMMICFKTYNKMLLVLFINVYIYFFDQPKEKQYQLRIYEMRSLQKEDALEISQISTNWCQVKALVF